MEESRERMAEDLGSGSWHSPRDSENGMYWPSRLPMCSPSLLHSHTPHVHTQLLRCSSGHRWVHPHPPLDTCPRMQRLPQFDFLLNVVVSSKPHGPSATELSGTQTSFQHRCLRSGSGDDLSMIFSSALGANYLHYFNMRSMKERAVFPI